jgi:hypothetical protein
VSAARRAPVEQVDAVDIYAPTDGGRYFRLKWTEPDGRPGDTTSGKTLDGARLKAAESTPG